jgi:hypothetical protein
MATVSGGDRAKGYLQKIADAAKPRTLNVGFLAGSTYPSGASVPLVATVQEFGGSVGPGGKWKIPPRPFFRSMVEKHKNEWPDQAARLLQANGYDTEKTFRTMGEVISGQLKQSIVSTNDPPLSPVTLMVRSLRTGKMNEPGSITTVFEAIRRVKAGETAKVRKPGQRGGRGSVSGKPLVYSGHLLSSVAYEIK